MDFVLITVTVMSLAMTLTMGVVTWQLVQEERRRSAARIRTLRAGLSRAGTGDKAEADVPAGRRGQQPPLTHSVSDKSSSDRPSTTAGETTIRLAEAAVAASSPQAPVDLFATVQHRSGGIQRVGAIAAAGLLFSATVALAMLTLVGGSRETAAAEAATPLPVELLSLRHTRHEDTLSISGFVRNPADGNEVKRLTAVVLLFDHEGSFVDSGRSLLEFTTLAPGTESPFVITVPAPDRVGRYRISFRTEDDRTVPHIDRRPAERPHQAGLVALSGG